MFEAQAMIHSKDCVEEITVIEKVGDNDYICKTKDGVKCHCIFNIFTGLYYADDLYTVIKD